MEHLTNETLARLVDERPNSVEREHLAGCARCQDEIEALREQTEALRHLPDLRPPGGGWDALEPRLRSEGLVTEAFRHAGTGQRHPAGGWLRGPALQAAAAVVLLAAGMGLGMGMAELETTDDPAEGALAGVESELAHADLTLDEAAELVRITEGWYMDALVHYRERLEGGASDTEPDPLTRWAALENLMAAGQAAVREAPTDPFINGLLVNMYAEREATLRGLEARTASHNWY